MDLPSLKLILVINPLVCQLWMAKNIYVCLSSHAKITKGRSEFYFTNHFLIDYIRLCGPFVLELELLDVEYMLFYAKTYQIPMKMHFHV